MGDADFTPPEVQAKEKDFQAMEAELQEQSSTNPKETHPQPISRADLDTFKSQYSLPPFLKGQLNPTNLKPFLF